VSRNGALLVGRRGGGALPWLTARPIAHRGLHDGVSVIENTASAVAAAIAGGYGIEVDLQVSADGEAMVHHDEDLGRLTDGAGPLRKLTAAALKQVAFKATADHMMTLGDLIDLVAGRAALLLEMKSRFVGDVRLAARVAAVLGQAGGNIGVMSFDPALLVALRRHAPHIVRGIASERHFRPQDWAARVGPMSRARRWELAFLLHGLASRPNFVAYKVADLAAFAPRAARHMFGLPMLTWTVRSAADRAMAARFADQMIFEGFRA
jgi:glycerophosphoryl diester phosphodiesterase